MAALRCKTRWILNNRLCAATLVHILILLFLCHFRITFKIIQRRYDITLQQLAAKSESDKFWAHNYQNAYAKYLEPRRFGQVKMLEIGLGCGNSVKKPGMSVEFWLQFFPSVDLWVFEYDGKCLDEFLDSRDLSQVHKFAGDQSSRADLRRFVNFSRGQFDIIVEDGSHEIEAQKTSFEILFPALKPRGLYFMEDLYYNFLYGNFQNYYKGHFGAYDIADNNTLKLMHNLIDNLMNPKYVLHVNKFANPKHMPPDSPVVNHELIESIDCFHQMCVIERSGKEVFL